MALIATILPIVALSDPAFATGSLTATSFTMMRGEAGLAGDRYDWGFTTATASTLDKVTLSVRGGSSAPYPYLATSGFAHSEASAATGTANNFTGDLDVRAAINPSNWASGSTQAIVSKWQNTNEGWSLQLTNTGALRLVRSNDGSTQLAGTTDSTLTVPHPGTDPVIVRATLAVNNGGGGGDTIFYYKTTSAKTATIDAASNTGWTQLGTTVTNSGTLSNFASSAPLEIGQLNNASATSAFTGKIYYAELRSGINGAAGNILNPIEEPNSAATWTGTDGYTWTIDRAAVGIQRADIASDLSVATVTGFPAGGNAVFRFVDNIVMYTFPSAQSIAAGLPVTLGVMGMINSTPAGLTTSTINTYNGYTAIDNGTATFTTTYQQIVTGAGTGTTGYSGDGGVATAAKVSTVGGEAADDFGNVYVADTANNVVRKIDQYGYISTLSLGVTLSAPSAVAYDTSNNILYVADSGNNTIRKYVVSTTTTTSVTTSLPSTAKGIMADTVGNVYVSTSDCRILRITSAGVISTVAGTSGTCTTSSGDGGAPASALLKNPSGLGRDVAGRILIAETGSTTTDGKIRRIDINAGLIVTIAGGGAGTTDNTLAIGSAINAPVSVTSDTTGQIYIGDSGDHNVRRFFAGGSIYTIVSSASGAAAGTTGDNGNAISAKVGNPAGLAISLGAIWIADATYFRIRKVADEAMIRPYVNADVMDMPKNQTQTLSLLSNDWKIDGEIDPTSITVTTPPANAASYSVSTTTGVLTYTPSTNFVGTDTLTYKVCDSTLIACNSAVVTINVGDDGLSVVLGNVAEDTSLNSAIQPNTMTRYKNWIFVVDATYQTIRRYDTYSKQFVIYAGTGLYTDSHFNNLQAQNAHFNLLTGLAVTPSGDIYASDSGIYDVMSISAPTGGVTRIAGNNTNSSAADGSIASTSAIALPRSIAIGPSGTVYVGSSSLVRTFTVGGTLGTAAGNNTSGTADGTSGGGGTARFSTTLYGLSVNQANGDVYVADTGNNAIRKISGANVTTVAGHLGTSGAEVNGTATVSYLNAPLGITYDPVSVSLLIADTGNFQVARFTDGGSLTSIGGNGGSAFGADGNVGTQIYMKKPSATVMGTNGDYYFVDTTNYRMRYVSAITTAGVVTTVAGNGTQGSMPGTTALNTEVASVQATSNNPDAILVDASGNIYYSAGDKTMVRVDGTTSAVTSGVLSAVTSSTGVGNMDFDSSGYIVAPAAGPNTIIRINPTTFASTTMIPTSCGCGAVLNAPRGIAYDAAKSMLYIANTGTNQILKYDGTNLTVIAGTGSAGGTGDGGPATAATFNGPYAVRLDSLGNIYVSETTGSRVRMIDTKGIITTIAGTGASGNTGDGGQSFGAQIGNDFSLTFDAANNLYMSESTNNVVRKINNNNVVSHVVGSGTFGSNFNVTDPLTARLRGPRGVAVNGADIYVADDASGRVLKAKGIATSGANVLSSAQWNVVPGASGHTTTLNQLVVKVNADTATSKLTFSVPSGTTGASPTVTEAYGAPGTVTASSPSSNVVTLSFGTPFTMRAGTSYAFTISGLSMTSVTNGAYTSGVTLFDNGGTPASVGYGRSSIVSLASGVPASTGSGFNSIWAKSSSVKINSGASSVVTIGPAGTTSGSTAVVVQTGSASTDNLNNANLAVKATANISSSSTLGPITPGVATGAALISAPNTWGTSLTSISSTGTAAAGLTGSNYVGNTTSSQVFVSGADGANTFTLNNGAYVDWRQPAGTYTSTMSFFASGGS